MHYAVDPERHAAIFGPVEASETPGKSRRCRSCGGWHRLDRPWPHNCRAPEPPRNPNLATPRVTPDINEAFVADPLTGEVITSKRDKREFMAKNDLVEYDPGVENKAAQWARDRENQDELGKTIKRFMDTDTDYWTPEQRGEVADTRDLGTGGVDIDATAAEVVE